MAEVLVSQKVTTDDLIDAYVHGMAPQAVADKFGVDVRVVLETIQREFPDDQPGKDQQPQEEVVEEPVEAPVKEAKK